MGSVLQSKTESQNGISTMKSSATKLLKIVEEIRPTLAEHSIAIDSDNKAPHQSYEIIRQSGLLGALVPEEHGGAGINFFEYCQLLERLAFFDGATALGFNMHNVAIGSLCEAEPQRLSAKAIVFREWIFNEIIAKRRLFASGTSETSTGAKLKGIEAKYKRCEHGYILNGHKSFVSLAGVADYYVITARPIETEVEDEVSHFVVSREDEGVAFEKAWPGFALNGTSTAGMRISNVLLGPQRLFMGIEGMSLFKVIREPHWMIAGYTSAYLGIADAIFQFACSWVGTRYKDNPSSDTVATIGVMHAQLQSARATINNAAYLVTRSRGTVAANGAIHAAKYLMGTIGQNIASEAVQLCGSSSLGRGKSIERLIREIQFCAVMPAKHRDRLEYLGKAALGYRMFDASTMKW